MTNENRANMKFHSPLTAGNLRLLQKKGYRYLQVKGFTIDHHYEYMEPQYLMLVPIKDLPDDPAKKDIYEPIDSRLLLEWANEKNRRVEVFIACRMNGLE